MEELVASRYLRKPPYREGDFALSEHWHTVDMGKGQAHIEREQGRVWSDSPSAKAIPNIFKCRFDAHMLCRGTPMVGLTTMGGYPRLEPFFWVQRSSQRRMGRELTRLIVRVW